MTPSAGRTAVVTLFSAARLGHVRRQQEALVASDPDVLRVLVWLDDVEPPSESLFDAATVVHVPPGEHGLRLAAGRNRGAEAALSAGACILVFLDADCVAGPSLVARYEAAVRAHDEALLCGPVTYLPEGFTALDEQSLLGATRPHPARPSPDDGESVVAGPDDYALFWSLSFAVSAATWRRVGGFSPEYEGYGGEDTDFAFRARALDVPLVWVGGAHAFHQYHPTSSPPWQHLDDILRNGAVFAARWGTWPMGGWLTAFADARAIRWSSGAWRRVPA